MHVFLFLQQNICYGSSLEAPQRNKKNINVLLEKKKKKKKKKT